MLSGPDERDQYGGPPGGNVEKQAAYSSRVSGSPSYLVVQPSGSFIPCPVPKCIVILASGRLRTFHSPRRQTPSPVCPDYRCAPRPVARATRDKRPNQG